MTKLNYDISIIGGGSFGLFTALLCSKYGLKTSVIEKSKKNLCLNFTKGLNTFWPTLNDPPTRAVVAHGQHIANYLDQFCAQGLKIFHDELQVLLKKAFILNKSKNYRVALKDFEYKELCDAQNFGFNLKSTQFKWVFEEPDSYTFLPSLKLQSNLESILKKNNIKIIYSEATSITEKTDLCSVMTKSKEIDSEILILGMNQDISKLCPKYRDILVPMSDVCFTYEARLTKIDIPYLEHENKNMTLRISNGHICVNVFTDKNHTKVCVKISGPRFLLPGAGVGMRLNKKQISQKTLKLIFDFHLKQIFPLIKSMYHKNHDEPFFTDRLKCVSTDFLIDCHPCDELPLVGEFGQFGKVLGFCGFLATGFSAGSLGARIMVDLILKNKSEYLNPILKPRRFKLK